MPINIIVDNIVGITVKGVITDALGEGQPFDFFLTCKRLDADELKARLTGRTESSITDFMIEVTSGWSGVKGEEDKTLAFSIDGLRKLLKLPGLAVVSFNAYMADVGAKEKN